MRTYNDSGGSNDDGSDEFRISTLIRKHHTFPLQMSFLIVCAFLHLSVQGMNNKIESKVDIPPLIKN
eukprot:scaffold656_cov271-Chaetoceros_neogracile.AAC.82